MKLEKCSKAFVAGCSPSRDLGKHRPGEPGTLLSTKRRGSGGSARAPQSLVLVLGTGQPNTRDPSDGAGTRRAEAASCPYLPLQH